ncbi:MAG: L-ribulose-5-phosphate 3-epimerase [Lachnospiraceae bacterium]|nr:L-ribulose-5-phosphate 3-epimerase [Lachnospiraceae bacterium]
MMSDEMPVFGIYEKAVRPQSFEDMFRDARKAGYQSFELSIDASDGRLKRLFWGKKEAAEVWQAALRQDMKILTMCLSGHKRFPLGSSDPEITSAGMKIMEKALELGGRLGIRIIQLSGFDVYDQEERTEETRKRYVDNIFRASRMAERACVMLAIEPVEGNLLAVRDTMEVVRKIDSHCLQIYPDVANINSLGIDPIQELPCGKGHIAAVHMRDSLPGIYDATIPFGSGYLDFDGVFQKLDEIGFCGPLVVEMWNTERPEYMEWIRQAREYMETHIRKVRESDV